METKNYFQQQIPIKAGSNGLLPTATAIDMGGISLPVDGHTQPFSETLNHLMYHNENILQIDKNTADFLSKKKNLWEVIAPTKETKLRDELNFNLFRANGNLRTTLYSIHAKYTIASVQDYFNTKLVVLSGQRRAMAVQVLSVTFIELANKVHDWQTSIITIIEEKAKQLQAIQFAKLRERFERDLEAETEQYLAFLQKMMSHYVSVMEIQIQSV